MKSKIFLDIDQDNKPIIKIRSFDNSDDLKDKFLRQLLNNNRPKRKSLNPSLSNAEREYESQLETDELVSAIGLGKIMMIDAEVLEIKFTEFNSDVESNSIDRWSEYIIKPKGYVYLLSATKTVKNNSKEYHEWEKQFNCCSNSSEVYDAEIKYNIKLEEAADYIKKGFKVTFANEIEVNLIDDEKYNYPVHFHINPENDARTFIKNHEIYPYLEKGISVNLGDYKLINVGGNVDQPKVKNLATSTLEEIYKDSQLARKTPKEIIESINIDLGDLSPSKSKLDGSTLSNIAKMHASNFINSGITTIIGNDENIINKIIQILENEYKCVQGSYTFVQESGITTFKKIKEIENLIPTGIDEKDLRRTGRTTRLIDDYIQQLFSGKEVLVLDHNKKINKSMCATIIERLKNEHGIFEDSVVGNPNNREGYGYVIRNLSKGILKLQEGKSDNFLKTNLSNKQEVNDFLKKDTIDYFVDNLPNNEKNKIKDELLNTKLNNDELKKINKDINNYIDELVSLFITNGFVDIDLDLIIDKKVFLEFFERKLKNATFDNYNILETVNSIGKKVLSVIQTSKKIF